MCQANRLLVVITLLIALIVIFLSAIIWQQSQSIGQLQSELGQLQSQLKEVQSHLKERDQDDLKQRDRFQNQLTELHCELNRANGKLGTKYEVLYKMVVADKEKTRQQVGKMFSLQIDLINNVIATKKEHEANISMLANMIDDNLVKVNQSMTGFVKLFVDKISECKDVTSTILQRLKQLEAREPVMIENTVVVEREYHLQHVDHQPSWGERIGCYIGRFVDDGVRFLARNAIKAIGLSS